MATSRSLNKLAARLKLQGQALEEGVEELIRKAALVVDQVVVDATPFDTGRARNNWIASVGSPLRGDRKPDVTGGEALSNARAAIQTFQLDFGSIFITNNVPYIIPLEMGSSKQAPQGMAKQAVAAGAQVVRSAGNLFRR